MTNDQVLADSKAITSVVLFTGLIILGLAAAATGLALNGSKGINDMLTYYQVADIVKVFEGLAAIAWAAGELTAARLTGDMKAIAISFQAEAFRPWW